LLSQASTLLTEQQLHQKMRTAHSGVKDQRKAPKTGQKSHQKPHQAQYWSDQISAYFPVATKRARTGKRTRQTPDGKIASWGVKAVPRAITSATFPVAVRRSINESATREIFLKKQARALGIENGGPTLPRYVRSPEEAGADPARTL
jgi:hypothetical protein